VFSSCEKNESIYNAFKLENIFNVTELVGNATSQINDLDSNREKLNVSLTDIL